MNAHVSGINRQTYGNKQMNAHVSGINHQA